MDGTLDRGEKNKKPFIRLILKIAVCIAVLFVIQRLVLPKYTGTVIEGNFTAEYYQDDTPHDLIIIGNCESYENISPMVLWDEYGITSYIRGNANQLIPQSYYILKETLRYEKPMAVLLNVQAMTVAEQSSEEYNRMVFDGMRWSGEKLEGIKASMLSDEKLLEYIFPILRYKGRITELESDDFRYAFSERPVKSHNGYYLRADIRPYDPEGFPYERRREDYSFSEKNWQYLELFADLCEENGIELILMKAPSVYPVWVDPYEEQIEAFANDRGLLYLNALEHEEIGIDMNTDTYDGGLHLNVYGAEKVSRWLGGILKEELSLPDHREDEELSKIYALRMAAYENEKQEQKEEFESIGYISRYYNE